MSNHLEAKASTNNTLKIGNVTFTAREIDVIACVISNRGEKKIASILSISFRTVSTHVRNIMLKLNCNSKENIIDAVEKSGKLLYFREHYISLLTHSLFTKCLLKIRNTINNRNIICKINFEQISEFYSMQAIIKDLQLVNIEIQNDDGSLMDLENSEYYFFVLQLLQNNLNDPKLDLIAENFKQEYDLIVSSSTNSNQEQLIDNKNESQSKKLYFRIFIIILLFICTFSIIQLKRNSNVEIYSITQDLPIPNDFVVLQRKAIISQIKEKFANSDAGISVIALVGPGGTGKTTIARQYAKSAGNTLVFEINAESRDSILASFEYLAYSLCQNDAEKQELTRIPSIQNQLEKEKKLLIFLKKQIKQHKQWCLIYDNATSFQDIQKYFPYDAKAWGQGDVIITTRDANITQSHHIQSENVIQIDPLNELEKHELFCKIMQTDCDHTDDQSSINYFLEQIPPFPLDISTAAYYIKSENITYDDYLKKIISPGADFISLQESILKDVGEYNQTRHGIITLSVKHIIDSNPKFADLLLLISLIEPDNIPKTLLIRHFDNDFASKFLHEARKLSLMTEKRFDTEHTSKFSIHRSNQQIILSYLIQSMQPNIRLQALKQIAHSLSNEVMESKYSIENNTIIFHAETFLNHKNLIDLSIAAPLHLALGRYYFSAANYGRAKENLLTALEYYNNRKKTEATNLLEVLTTLGGVYRNTGEYYKAIESLENAFKVYDADKRDSPESISIATLLGSVYRSLGRYQEAKACLENSYSNSIKLYGKDNIKTIRVKAYLGSLYQNLGNTNLAKQFLEEAYSVYEKRYGTNHVQTAWISTRLGKLYKQIGEYNQAKTLLEKALKTYTNILGENCIETGWVMVYLGDLYNSIQEASKGKDIIMKGIKIYSNHFDENHPTMAWAFLNLAKSHLLLGEKMKAKALCDKVLQVYQTSYGHDHIKTQQVLNYLKQSL